MHAKFMKYSYESYECCVCEDDNCDAIYRADVKVLWITDGVHLDLIFF